MLTTAGGLTSVASVLLVTLVEFSLLAVFILFYFASFNNLLVISADSFIYYKILSFLTVRESSCFTCAFSTYETFAFTAVFAFTANVLFVLLELFDSFLACIEELACTEALAYAEELAWTRF